MGRLGKAKWCLLGCLIVVLTLAVGSVFVPNGLTNAVKWLANNDFACKLRALSEQEPEHPSILRRQSWIRQEFSLDRRQINTPLCT